MYNIKKNVDKLKRGEATFFLDPSEEKEVSKYFRKDEFKVFKPYPESEKVILYNNKEPKVVLFKIITKEKLRHQDILGSIFSLNVDKEVFGDIILDNDNYYFYLLESMKDYFLINFTKVKKFNIELEEIDINSLKDYQKNFKELELIVKSPRLDSVIAGITNTSRSKIKEKVKDKDIILNYSIFPNQAYVLKEGDIFSIRKYGKFKYLGKVKETKKKSLIIKIVKYI